MYHQNVQSLTNKIDELSIAIHKNYTGPHFICLTEHHLKETEITKISFEGYTLASAFCRKKSLGGGVCIFINKNLAYHSTDLNQFCYEKTLEICAVKLHLKSLKLIIFCIYRAPMGDLKQFYTVMENILNHFLKPTKTFLICGDLNINLLSQSNEAIRLIMLMNT